MPPPPLLIALRVRREGEPQPTHLPSGVGSRAEPWPPEATSNAWVSRKGIPLRDGRRPLMLVVYFTAMTSMVLMSGSVASRSGPT